MNFFPSAIPWFFRPVSLNRSRGLRQFVFRILVQQFAVKVLVAVVIVAFLPEAEIADRTTILREPVLAAIILVVIAPIAETFLLQTATIETCRALRGRRPLQFAVGSVPFAALHFIGGVASGIAAGVVGGAFFAHTYLECRQRSWWTATWVTAVTHGIHNLIVLPIIFLAVA
jgi:hypothetical protein